MSVNDKEIDVLLRRYAQAGAVNQRSAEHLDADELNAFAEGTLPASARQHFVAHLADCDDCRKLAAQLAIASGAAGEAHVPAAQPVAESWSRKLGAFLSPTALRYAAFAVLLVAVVGISFLAWRRPAQPNAESLAQNQPQTRVAEPTNAQSAQEAGKERTDKTENLIARAVPQPTVAPNALQQSPAAPTAAAPPPPKPESPSESTLAARSSNAPAAAEASPSYAPQPAETYKLEDRAREQRNAAEPSPSGPRRGDYDKYKSLDRAATVDSARARDEESKRAANEPAAKDAKENVAAAQASAGTFNIRGRTIQEMKIETRKSDVAEEAVETRSAGGRKFRRQGNAWVDAKFKASMSVRNVARGTEDFGKLDSGLRSIAQQLSGEIVVVWKGKAYRIR